jgi:LytS/YehU family sensor histidine kinase
MLIAFSYGMIRESIRKERIQKEKENETLKSELQFLRWQVNPHFLFNVLNNIVALARLKSEKLEPILIKLSTLLRYMLYEASETKISINKEVEYLQSYIDIQCLRIDKETVVTTKFDVFGNSYTIEPMLLIPLIENAFKHGIGLVQNPMINIEMEMNEGTLLFVIRNTYNKNLIKNDTDEPPGIGLLNVRRRLELIYKDKHTLDIDANGVFTVTLKIDLG